MVYYIIKESMNGVTHLCIWHIFLGLCGYNCICVHHLTQGLGFKPQSGKGLAYNLYECLLECMYKYSDINEIVLYVKDGWPSNMKHEAIIKIMYLLI